MEIGPKSIIYTRKHLGHRGQAEGVLHARFVLMEGLDETTGG